MVIAVGSMWGIYVYYYYMFVHVCAVIEHSFFSEDSNSPKQYNIRQGEPSSLRCGNVSSQPAETLRWDRQFAQTVFRPLDPSRETVAPDGSLFLREPSLADDRKIYRCIATNSVLQGQGFGYIQISVTREFGCRCVSV